jgi:hypothetical protein
MKPLHDLLQRHDEVLSNHLGFIKSHPAHIHVSANSTHKFHKPCPVPFAIKDAVTQELNHLEKQASSLQFDTVNGHHP